MSNPIRPSDCPSVLGVHAHFRVSRYSLLDKDTKEGKGAGPTTVRGQAVIQTAVRLNAQIELLARRVPTSTSY